MATTVWNIIFWFLRWKLSSQVLEIITALVEEIEKTDLPGKKKMEAVWAGLWNSPEVREVVSEKGRFLINWAIETVVARMRGV